MIAQSYANSLEGLRNDHNTLVRELERRWNVVSNGTVGKGANRLTVGTLGLALGSVTAPILADFAVTTQKVLDGAISELKVADLAVTEAKVAANAITAVKVSNGAIETDKLAANAVTAAKITAGTITATQIASETILADNLAANSVVAGKIAALAVTTGKLAALAVTAAKIAANTITANEIAANTITVDQMAANSVTATEINVSTLSSMAADMGTVTAGTLTLPSGGHVKSGQTAYDSGTGFWLGNDSGTPKFSIGNSGGDKLIWSGSALTITGAISGGSIDVGSGDTKFKAVTGCVTIGDDTARHFKFDSVSSQPRFDLIANDGTSPLVYIGEQATKGVVVVASTAATVEAVIFPTYFEIHETPGTVSSRLSIDTLRLHDTNLYRDSANVLKTDDAFVSAASVTVDNGADESVIISTGSGYAVIEVGGDSGAYMDLKAPASDDYDLRLIADGNCSIQTANNQDLRLTPHGTGYVRFGTYVGGLVTVGGKVAFRDAGGTLRYLLCE